jgi:copper(I)-binding protein
MAAGYFRLKNRSGQTLRLRAVSSSALGSVAMHETLMDQGVSKMRALEDVEFASGAELVFEPGGRHLMISGLPEVAAPDGIPITLAFVRNDGTSLQVEVKFKLLGGDETDGVTDHSGHSH